MPSTSAFHRSSAATLDDRIEILQNLIASVRQRCAASRDWEQALLILLTAKRLIEQQSALSNAAIAVDGV
jgi:hypothetical protein